MFAWLKKGADALKDFQADLTKKDDLRRAVFLGVSVAFADGELEPQEREMLPKLAQQLFPNFVPGEIAAVVREAIEAHSISAEMGFLKTEEEIEGVESTGETRKLFALARAIALADGEMEPGERTVIMRFAALLGLSATQLGIK